MALVQYGPSSMLSTLHTHHLPATGELDAAPEHALVLSAPSLPVLAFPRRIADYDEGLILIILFTQSHLLKMFVLNQILHVYN